VRRRILVANFNNQIRLLTSAATTTNGRNATKCRLKCGIKCGTKPPNS
jgi:hypothetical protein